MAAFQNAIVVLQGRSGLYCSVLPLFSSEKVFVHDCFADNGSDLSAAVRALISDLYDRRRLDWIFTFVSLTFKF